jgi:hypothetical protein
MINVLITIEEVFSRLLQHTVHIFAGCGVFQIILNSEYNEASFKRDLKKLFNLVGVAMKPTVFLVTAALVTEEGKSIQNLIHHS